ncbi:MAG: 4Fe-4S dicluster domain-containing protein, partial [Calditrichaeota bacterium]|nr:4Fe-4S dicluster domain-containing protein [Calditrichota bacterium]
MSRYFNDVFTGVSTILLGMWITFKHLFQPTITVQYPREMLKMYPCTRARLFNHIEDCSFCLSCQKACPAHIFTIKGVRMDANAPQYILPDGKPKKINVVQFDIDMAKCLYCGLCVEACDTKSLRWEKPQEQVVYDRRELYKEFSGLTHEQRDAA